MHKFQFESLPDSIWASISICWRDIWRENKISVWSQCFRNRLSRGALSCQLKIIGWKGKIGFVINHFASREWRVNHKSRSPSYFNFHSVPILNLHQIYYPRWSGRGGRTMELKFQWNLVNGKVHELEPTWLEGWRRKEETQICLLLTTNRWNTNRRKM